MEKAVHATCPIVAARAEIMREWEEISRRTFPAASAKARGELRDHLPDLLEHLCETLRGHADDDVERLSRTHGRQRFSVGDFTIDQILGEYRLLKEIVLRFDRVSAGDREARVLKITAFFDEASSTAVTEFVNLREAALRDAGARLVQLNDELERFTAVVAHDLRSPLGTVLGYAELLGEEGLSPLAEKQARVIHATAGRAIQLIDRLLQYTKVGHVEPDSAPVDLDAVWRATRENLANAIVAAGARVESADLGETCGDAVLLSQLLQNLVANSLKFRKPDEASVISIQRVREAAEETEFSVSDNGVGFDPAQSEAIFRPFARAHGAVEYQGTGLGLATCQRVVERHGGRIWASGEVGRGATVSFTLPKPCSR